MLIGCCLQKYEQRRLLTNISSKNLDFIPPMGEKTTTMGIFSSNCNGLSGGADRKNAVLPCGVGKYGVWPSSDMLMLWGGQLSPSSSGFR